MKHDKAIERRRDERARHMDEARFWKRIAKTSGGIIGSDGARLHVAAVRHMRRAVVDAKYAHRALVFMKRTGRYMSPDGREQND
jgi:hypothetical protein